MKDCVGCGYCCKKATCVIGQMHYKTPWLGTKCPGLYRAKGRYWCALAALNPEGLAIGAGCCCPLNTDRRAYGADRSRNRDR